MNMDYNLLNILACPVCKGKLKLDRTSNELICHFDQIAFPIESDIPILVVEKARSIEG